MRLDADTKDLFKKVRTKLGAPVRQVQLEDEQLCDLFEMCVEDYAEVVQNWILETQWMNLNNKDISTTDIALALSARTFDHSKDYSYWFSKEVGLQQRGPWELKKDFIEVERGKQSYLVPANREINKVMFVTPGTMRTAMMAGMTGVGAIGLGVGGGFAQIPGFFGTAGGGMSGFYIGSAFDSMLLASDLKMKNNILRSDLTYKVTAGPEGTRIIHLLSTPGSNFSFNYGLGDGEYSGYGLIGSKVWYTYYETKSKKDAEKCRLKNPDIILTPDQVPIEKLTYSLMNEPTKVLIRKLLIAESKILLGNIRGYASGKISIPEAELTLDYAMLHEQGKAEKEEAIKELRERLGRMSPAVQLELQAKMAEDLLRLKRVKPVSGWLVI